MRVYKRFIVIFLLIIGVVHISTGALLINIEGDFVEKGIVVDKNIEKDYNYLKIDVKIPQLQGLGNKDEEKAINTKISDKTNLWISDVESLAKEYFDESKNEKPTFPYELKANYKVKNVGNILSFYIDYYQFTGGAHGITNRIPYNINIITGKELKLKDLFKKEYDYTSIINSEIEKEIKKNPENYFTGKDGFNGIKDEQLYYLDNGDLVIHFGYYEIAPYAAGMQEFKIAKDIFKDNFIYDKL